jgi:hypothetical protein
VVVGEVVAKNIPDFDTRSRALAEMRAKPRIGYYDTLL